MKKYFVMIVAMALLIFTGCGQNEDSNTVTTEDREPVTNTEIVDVDTENGNEKYVITFIIKQSHFTLDVGEHIKDAMNKITIEIPVDKDYYDSVSVGDVINNEFRVGSLIMRGSFGNWKITVDKKEIR